MQSLPYVAVVLCAETGGIAGFRHTMFFVEPVRLIPAGRRASRDGMRSSLVSSDSILRGRGPNMAGSAISLGLASPPLECCGQTRRAKAWARREGNIRQATGELSRSSLNNRTVVIRQPYLYTTAVDGDASAWATSEQIYVVTSVA